MKLHTSDTPKAAITGALETSDFKFKMTAQAVQILSSGLYSDPVAAIIRELSCNAHDAHVAAGRPERPFRVSLPGRLSPEFVIRDFGPGLSHADAMELYTTYFESSKTNTNHNEELDADATGNFVTGALGLGSKSPLGYTNNYSVTSYQDGKKRIYSIYINDETGLPCCAYGGEFDTDEENGLEVRVPARDDSSPYEWTVAARNIYCWFPVLPEGLPDDIEGYDAIKSLGRWEQVELVDASFNDWRVKMGNVAYPLNFKQLDERFRMLSRYTTGIVHARMGDVMFTPSREDLYYNTSTVAWLESQLDAFLAEQARDMMDKLNGIDSFKELSKFYTESSNFKLTWLSSDFVAAFHDKEMMLRVRMASKSNITFNIQDYVNWKTADINSMNGVELAAHQETWALNFSTSAPRTGTDRLVIEMLQQDMASTPTHYSNILLDGHFTMLLLDSVNGVKSWYLRNGKLNPTTPWDQLSAITLIVNDEDRRSLVATRNWLKKSNHSVEDGLVLYADNADVAKEVTAWLDKHELGYTTVPVSTTAIDSFRNATVGGGVKGATVMINLRNPNYDPYRNNSKPTVWHRGMELSEVLDNHHDDYVWVEANGYDYIDSAFLSRNGLEHAVTRLLGHYGRSGIVFVNAKYVDEFKNDPRWIHIDAAAQAYFNTRIANLCIDDLNGHVLATELRENDLGYFVPMLRKNVDLLVALPKLQALLKTVPLNYTSSNRIDSLISLAKSLDAEMPKVTIDVEAIVAAAKKVYTSVPCSQFLHQAEIKDAMKIINTFAKEVA